MKSHILILTAIILFVASSCDKEDHRLEYSDSLYSGITGNYNGGTEIPGDLYAEQEENPFINTAETPISTFSIDADGASYSNIRRFILKENQLPPKGAVRTEELINYFDMDYDYQPSSHPISLNGEVSSCPWAESHKLIRIGIKGKPIPEEQLPASNFVFLIDVSGSMSSDDKLELLKEGFTLFVDRMENDDRVAIVTYAGTAGLVLESTSGQYKQRIKDAIHSLGSGGSTAGAEGIITAYKIAEENFIPNGNNRIILGTDGDFNVGISDREELIKLIEEKRDHGIYLTVVGVGRGNLNDAALEQIADHGNGNYEYVDDLEQLKKVFIYEFSKFYTVAKDVKVQIEFNPEVVHSYRLIGYENRVLNNEDFEDDKKDAGEIGADQSITALYEIIPVENIDFRSDPTFKIDFRYKEPDSDTSIPMQLEIFDDGKELKDASDHMIFSSGIAAFSMQLNDSKYKGTFTYTKVLQQIESVNLADPYKYLKEFKEIVAKAKSL